MLDSNRLLESILNRMLALLPTEPAAFKRLDDIGEAEPASSESASSESEILESEFPESAVHSAMRAAS